MNKRRFLSVFSACIGTGSVVAAQASATTSFEKWHKRSAAALKTLGEDPDKLSETEVVGLIARARSREVSIALPAVFTRWLRSDFQQLKWWTAGNSEEDVRIAIVALHELSAPEPEPHLGYFEDNAARFAEDERRHRLAEVALVRSDRALFAAAFHEAIKGNPSHNPRIKELRKSFERHANEE